MNNHLRIAAFLTGTAVVALAQAPEPRERYQAITREIFFNPPVGESVAQMNARAKAFHFPPAERMEQATVELYDLAQSTVRTALSSADASAESVQATLRDLQGRDSLVEIYPESSNVPFADMQNVNGFPALTAAFGVLRGGIGIPKILPYIQFYSQAGGAWKLTAETGADFRGHEFSLARVPPPPGGHEIWYLVWGMRIGDTGARLRIEVFGFDGLNARSVWSRDDLLAGTVSVASGSVRLEYSEEVNPGLGYRGARKRVVEILHPGLNGLELVERSEHPE